MKIGLKIDLKLGQLFTLVMVALFFKGPFAHATLLPAQQYEPVYALTQPASASAVDPDLSVQNSSQSFDDLSADQFNAWTSPENIQTVFEKLRDVRFLIANDQNNFIRRITWLYPEEGCFFRAEAMKRKLLEWSMPVPQKIFIFGNLQPHIKGNKDAFIWWYHVALAYRMDNQILVFDPSLEINKVISIKEWALKLGRDPSDFSYSVCDNHAWDPNSLCHGENENKNQKDYVFYAQKYLKEEWNKVLRLGLSPFKILGDEPPWRTKEMDLFGSFETN